MYKNKGYTQGESCSFITVVLDTDPRVTSPYPEQDRKNTGVSRLAP